MCEKHTTQPYPPYIAQEIEVGDVWFYGGRFKVFGRWGLLTGLRSFWYAFGDISNTVKWVLVCGSITMVIGSACLPHFGCLGGTKRGLSIHHEWNLRNIFFHLYHQNGVQAGSRAHVMRCEACGVNLCLRVLSTPGNENLNQLINWEGHHVPIKRLIIAYHCNPNLANLNSYRKLSLCTGLKTLNVYYMNVLELSTPRFFLNFALPAALEDQQESILLYSIIDTQLYFLRPVGCLPR